MIMMMDTTKTMKLCYVGLLLKARSLSRIANRKNGVSVDDEDTDDCESYWFSAQSTQKHVQLYTNTAYVELLCTTM